MTNCITIYTDASVDHDTQTGGWACWIKRAPGESGLFSGIFKQPVKCTTDAELRAIANGLAHAIKLYTPEKMIIVVVTDSESAQHYLNFFARGIIGKRKKKRKNNGKNRSKQRKLNPALLELSKKILSLVPPGCQLRVNKVKGHASQDGARSYVNNMVDRAARAAMRSAKKERKAA